jgi:beta-xylosidase
VTFGQPGPWTADLGDGTYRNPVLFADWSDPDVIRAGGDYYLVASSFNRVPGLPVLHSTDLVNWRLLGHALDRLTPESFFATPRHGCGVWAPAIRHHAGRFWICYPDPDHGIYLTTAPDPAGPWTTPRLVLAGRGLIDPCPLWDDDGNTYLIHAWARSRSGINNRLTAYRMTADLGRPLGDGVLVVDGDAIDGCRTLEGPKWYRRDGWYWIFAPGGGVANGWQYALRSRSVLGPYEPRVVLARGGTDVNGPHQGAWVDTPGGEDWFLHFQDLGPYGRVVHLQPMRWRPDGWPDIGNAGTPVARHRKPAAGDAGAPACSPPAGDGFPGGRPGPQWTWPANPRPGWVLERPGANGLRLACVPSPGSDLRALPNTLGQRLAAPRLRAETGVRLTAPAGTRAGLLVLGNVYAWAGLERRPGGTFLVCRFAEPELIPPNPSTPVSERDMIEPVPVEGHVRLAVTVGDSAVVQFAAAVAGGGWTDVGPPFRATPGGWIGATLALFATSAPRPAATDGFADFDPLLVTGPADRPLSC